MNFNRTQLSKKIILSLLMASVVSYGGVVSAAEITSTVTSDTSLDSSITVNVNGNSINRIGAIALVNGGTGFTVSVSGDSAAAATNTAGAANGILLAQNGQTVTLDGSDATLSLAAHGYNGANGINVLAGNLTVHPALVITADKTSQYGSLYGILSGNPGNAIYPKNQLNFNNTVAIKAESAATGSAFTGIGNTQSIMNFAKAVTIDLHTPGGTAINTIYGGQTTFNDAVTANVQANSSNAVVYGINALSSGVMENNKQATSSTIVFNGTADITANNPTGIALGVVAQNATIAFKDKAVVTATGADADSAAALYSYNGTIDLAKSTLSPQSVDAITAQITGAVQAENSGKINLNLTGAGSNVNGGIFTLDSSTITLSLHDQAAWNNTGVSNVTYLNLDKGIVKQSAADGDTNTINVANYSGTGTVQYTGTVTDGQLASVAGGNVTVGTAAEGSVLNVETVSDGTNTLDKTKAAASLTTLAQKLNYTANDGNLTSKAILNEGLITPRAIGTVTYNANGVGTVSADNVTWTGDTPDNPEPETPPETGTMTGMKNLAAVDIIAWRQENNNLLKRLGDLRASKGDDGIWARMSRGQFEYKGDYANQYNYFQGGYDKKLSRNDGDAWYVGAAISHMDGRTSFAEGNGDNKSTGLAVYGAWLGTKGHYADMILKQSRLSMDYDLNLATGQTHGDYDNWGTSFSVEYGRRIDLRQNWFVEPQAELTLGRISGADYTTDNGIIVSQDTLHSAAGRLGLRLGRKLGQDQQLYARASRVHEFAGNAKTQLELQGVRNSYTQDIGSEWWELGFGGTFKLGKAMSAYMDFEKTVGDDVRTPWQWNIGARWSF
jgi:outer membrane autotransporter protein